MLVRLQNVLEHHHFIEEMILLPEPAAFFEQVKLKRSLNLVVGYNASSESQTALDLTMKLAHQTRLATQKQVTVQVVYVVDETQNHSFLEIDNSEVCDLADDRSMLQPFSQSEWFGHAERILWQARCLAEDWRSSFKAHLRFGDVATELRTVVESEEATLLFLGCDSAYHPIVQSLGANFPCSVLGIPTALAL
jgi:nucleotide-binding universal stress UspA family protein